eukprot:TRINITY_DN16403_c0_g1_i1.p2 TRINITY_DN16403_c0_g1~~TRINITY_DN16403_c0_g1_i1.p2  ORF type:complete len:385 (-),score=81.10 TRINITY_DN16403_c0_g1_i1:33-1187(-)
MERGRYVLLLLVIFTLVQACSGGVRTTDLQFPYTLLHTYDVTYEVLSSPTAQAFVENGTRRMMAVSPVSIAEIRATRNLLLARADDAWKAELEVVQQFNISQSNWNSTLIETNLTRTMSYSSIIPNGANFNAVMAVNNVSEMYVTIPRDEGNFNCSLSPLPNQTCICNEDHELKINSMKLTIEINNWDFTDLPTPSKFNQRYIMIGLQLRSRVDLDKYLQELIKVRLDYSSYECDVVNFTLPLDNGTYLFPMSFFSHGIYDGNVGRVYDIVDLSSLEINQNVTGESSFIIYLFFSDFNHSIVYDPDFTVLFSGTREGGGGGEYSSKGAGEGGGGGRSLSSGAIVGIVIGVLAGALLCAIILAAGGAIFVKLLHSRRNRRRTVHV